MPKSVPNYLTVAPSGAVGAVFPGGVQMPEANDVVLPPANTRSLRWVRESNGATVANIYAVNHDGSGPANLVIKSAGVPDLPGPSQSGNVELWAESGAVGAAEVRARAGVTPGKVAVILDSTGRSDFLLKPTAAAAGIVLGQTNNNGGGACPFTIPAGPARSILVRMSMTGYVGAGGLYFHGFQIPGVGVATRDFFYNLTATHMTAGTISGTFTNLAPGNYSLSPYHNVTFDANDRYECSIVLIN